MRYKLASILCLVSVLIYSVISSAADNKLTSNSPQLPPIETFLLEPIELQNFDLWVPVAKIGPLINRSCQPKKNLSYSCALPASVAHTKTESCPEEIARLLAEYTACYHEQSMPLTIFNGWQWEYSYSLCQFESVTYDLSERGGSWENSWEAILTQSAGSIDSQWIPIYPLGDFPSELDNGKQESNIVVGTFSYMRIRDEYPKKRQL